MKKNLLTKKTTKKTTKRSVKKTVKKSRAKKTLSRDTKIANILKLVREIGEYARENLCVEDAQMEELEWKLNEYIR